MNVNMQQWAGQMTAYTETLANVILTSDNSPSDLHLLSSLLISVSSTAAAIKRLVDEGKAK